MKIMTLFDSLAGQIKRQPVARQSHGLNLLQRRHVTIRFDPVNILLNWHCEFFIPYIIVNVACVGGNHSI